MLCIQLLTPELHIDRGAKMTQKNTREMKRKTLKKPKRKLIPRLKFYLIPGWRDPEFSNIEYEIGKMKSKRKVFRRLLAPLTITGFFMIDFILQAFDNTPTKLVDITGKTCLT